MAHSEATAEQLERLEPLFAGLGVEPGAIESAPLSGLRTERDDRVADLQDPVLGDLVEAELGRAIERLDLTKLETLLTLADRMDLPDEVVAPLEQTKTESGIERIQELPA
ncbi:DUF892 family protein (plasmid) [Natronorubrum bangense]|uniref:DUF892 family protein n=3 Tax=Natronorubrum bangense TaxID=61858 RepID=A0A4D6HGF8_9EURY|nr:DUF892 family protein [Natronorubrum bangense]ELY43604.1 hypothetical protein C494_18868 [Natronorubrum bangense JCM 10635]QCC53194.1 DUF892 family protein [Natronorubrum bangense]QCC56113.1 DUF892 family protein [Natronorubrum bangense]